ncbi:alpha/beta hydrolase [Brevundimonas sp. 2R-24]|uniref:Alpha/beta hydrolase n=1 Tax=Peiella sedimenti TaxID=3061083 RepID=A0ABT8SMR4_9CAUL|nr:alpha/beta hydrolase [Caulobacteraceae bacterium XZ-24]
MTVRIAAFALAATILGVTDSRAQDHGSTTSVGVTSVDEAAAFHAQYFSRPRTYTLTNGQTLIIGPFQGVEGSGESLVVFDTASGRMIGVGSPSLDTLAGQSDTFVLKAHGAQIEWTPRGRPPVTGAQDPELAYEDIRFGANGISGRLTALPGDDRRPVVVLSPGSGPASINFTYFPALAAHLARNGFRVLTYDKPGAGPAGAPYRDRVVSELAEDINAAVAALRMRSDVDAANIGVVGISQAGWSAPLAAVDGGGIAFMALVSAPPVSSWEQEFDSLTHDLAGFDLTDAQRQEARRAMQLMFEAARAGRVTEALSQAVSRIRDEAWFPRTSISDQPQDIAAWSRGYFDPKMTIERLNLPVFLAFGGSDRITPYAPYIPVWRERLAVAGANDVTIKVYPGYGHGLVNPVGPDRLVAPQFLSALTTWLRGRAGIEAVHEGVSDAGALSQADAMMRVQDLVGNYIVGGKTVALMSVPRGLLIQDLASGRIGFLQPDAESSTRFRLVSPDGWAVASPQTVSFRLTEDGPSLILAEGNRQPQTAVRSAAIEEAVSYITGDGLEQHGILFRPPGPGPHPVVVFQGGAGPSTRENFRAWAHMFAANGIAALGVDKRGYGLSPGDGPSATLAINAADASAAVDYLASRDDIRSDRIGLIGSSRGGWTAAMAAGVNPKIAFLVMSSSGPTSPRVQERYARILRVESAGHPAETVDLADRILSDYFAYLASGRTESAARVSENWRLYGQEPWYGLLRLPPADPTTGTLSSGLQVFSDDLRFDARSAFDILNIPVLFLLGEMDEAFPNSENVRLIEDMAQNHQNWTIRLFDGGNHNLMLEAPPGDVQRTAPGYYDAMVDWVVQQTRD